MSDSWCKTCGDFMLNPKTHVCDPAFLVWYPEYGQTEEDGARKVYAADHEQAAERWAERNDADTCDYAIVGGSEVVLHVKKAGEDEVKKFTVTGRSEPVYDARPVK